MQDYDLLFSVPVAAEQVYSSSAAFNKPQILLRCMYTDHAKAIWWWYFRHIAWKTNVTYISEHQPWETQKSQNPNCGLFPEELTHGALQSSPAPRIVWFPGMQRCPGCSTESRQPQQAAAKLFSLPQTTPKSDTSSSERADTCRCLLALTTHKNGLSVLCASWIFLYHWERKIMLGRSQQDEWYF